MVVGIRIVPTGEYALTCVHLKIVIIDASCAGPGNEIVVDNVMAEYPSCIGDCIARLVIVYYIVDILRVGLGKWLAIVSADPKISIVGGLLSFDVRAKLLSDWEGDDGIGNSYVGDSDTIN